MTGSWAQLELNSQKALYAATSLKSSFSPAKVEILPIYGLMWDNILVPDFVPV